MVTRLLLAIALCLLSRPATADEAPTPHIAAQEQPGAYCFCQEPENGARPGEILEQRLMRLERAFRLSKAERFVAAAKRVHK